MCNEKCTHCMVNALPDGLHMKSATFAKALDFGLLNKLKIFSISGGEPTLHPEFFKLMHFMFTIIKNKEVGVLLESNGWWIEDKKMCERISKLLDHPQVLGMQISTNKKYYPNYEWTMSHREDYEKLHSKIKFTADWQGVDTHLRYMGRGKNIMNKDDATGFPNCMNWVSYALNLNNFGIPRNKQCVQAIGEIAIMRGKVCTPYITYDGRISICEGDCVPSLISLDDWFVHTSRKLSDEMFKKILDFIPCNKCGTFKNMSQEMCYKFDNLREQFGLPRKFEEAWLKLTKK